MAIDTTNKKLALLTYLLPFYPALPTSSDGLGQDDKQHLLWEYPGILWTAPVVPAVWDLIRQELPPSIWSVFDWTSVETLWTVELVSFDTLLDSSGNTIIAGNDVVLVDGGPSTAVTDWTLLS